MSEKIERARTPSIERISTGIPRLNELLKGGIPKGFFVAVVGEPACGKTILSLHITNSCLKNGMPVIYITTEESRESIITQASQFGFDFQKYIDKETLFVVDALMRDKNDEFSLTKVDPENLISKATAIKKEKIGYKDALLVVDSMSAFWLDKPAMSRKYSYQIKRVLYRWKFTIIATSQYAITTGDSFGFGLEHIADGIIRMRKFIRGGILRRGLMIEKMRQTEHDLRLWEIEIVNGRGIILKQPLSFRREDFALPKKVYDQIIEAKRRQIEEVM